MPLEPCPTCGYALSTVGSHCRHCTSSFNALPASRSIDAKVLTQIIGVLVTLGALLYVVFLR
ncbi:MAG: hypothetical protein ABI217_12425 [Chthoniobacterales bacterium]